MPHTRREAFASRFPVHVTVRMQTGVWNLRSRRSWRVIAACFGAASERFGVRVCAFSVQGNHLHLVAEAKDAQALSRAMKGLGVRLAKGLNRMMGRKGKVIGDRYHAHVLRTPSETRNAVHYVLHNHRKHQTGRPGPLGSPSTDAFAHAFAPESALEGNGPRLALPAPATWLLRGCLAVRAGASGPPQRGEERSLSPG
jgi:REP element-mobilizing transposase RayT